MSNSLNCLIRVKKVHRVLQREIGIYLALAMNKTGDPAEMTACGQYIAANVQGCVTWGGFGFDDPMKTMNLLLLSCENNLPGWMEFHRVLGIYLQEIDEMLEAEMDRMDVENN